MPAARTLRLRALEQLRGPAGALLFVALAVAVLLPLVSRLHREVGGFYATLGDPSPILLTIAATLLAGLVVLATAIRAQYRARLVLDAEGVRYESGWPASMRGRFDWRLRWTEIRTANVASSSSLAPLLRTVVLESAERSRSISPWQWLDPDDPDDVALTGAATRLGVDRTTLGRIWEETVLVRALVERGLLRLDGAAASASGDVQSSTTARALATAMIAAIVYAIGDIYFGLDEFYAGGAPIPLFVAVGAAGAGLGWMAFAPGLRTRGEAVAIVAMFGFGIGLASYPLALRLNAWTDEDGLVDHEYVLGEEGRWLCLDGTAPALTFDIGTGYWRQFEPGDRKTFRLRRGGLGFHQVDMRPIYDEQRAFYRRGG